MEVIKEETETGKDGIKVDEIEIKEKEPEETKEAKEGLSIDDIKKSLNNDGISFSDQKVLFFKGRIKWGISKPMQSTMSSSRKCKLNSIRCKTRYGKISPQKIPIFTME